jgi:translocation and assembly module TamA
MPRSDLRPLSCRPVGERLLRLGVEATSTAPRIAGLVGLALAGCSTPPTGPVPPDPTAQSAAAAPSVAASAAAPDASANAAAQAPAAADDEDNVSWTLDIDAPEAVRPLLDRYLDLSRFRRNDRSGAIPRSELLRLLSAAPAQVRKLLETEGYFDAQVSTELPAGALAEGQRSGSVSVRLKVLPGPITRVGEVQLEIHGPLGDAVEAGDASAIALATQLRKDWRLHRGDSFTQRVWDDAKSSALNLLHAEGYPAGSWMRTQARVLPGEQKADLLVTLDSGPMFRIGDLRIEGLDHVNEDAVIALRNFGRGTPLRERVLLDFQDRLVKSNLFDGVSVTYEPDPAQAAATTLVLRLRERMLQQATVGVEIGRAHV